MHIPILDTDDDETFPGNLESAAHQYPTSNTDHSRNEVGDNTDIDYGETFAENDELGLPQHPTLNADHIRHDLDDTNTNGILAGHNTSIASGIVDDNVNESREEYVASPARRAKTAAIWRTDLKDSADDDDDLYNDYDDYDDEIDYDGTPKVPRDNDIARRLWSV